MLFFLATEVGYLLVVQLFPLVTYAYVFSDV